MTLGEKKKKFNATLFQWHKTHYRDMPWRPPKSRGRDRASLDPYRILVSEVMLQQTQVDRVRTKYVEFLKKFPSVRVLAQASLGDVLRAWSGLGYNRRARYLHDCAKTIVSDCGGKFPHDLDELMKLPGVGRSTAGALLAFSFGQDTPMIDTNIRRILTRVFFPKALRFEVSKVRPLRSFLRSNLSRTFSVSDKELYIFAKSLIPKGRGRAWNYALLDLGATLCAARNHSEQCPLMKLHGKVGDFQYKKPQKKFAHSDRYYRGRIVALLATKKSCLLRAVEKALGIANIKTDKIIRKLLQEGILKRNGNLLKLP